MDKDKEIKEVVVNEETLNVEQEEEAGLMKEDLVAPGNGPVLCC
ncbi:hypothetical protein R2R35_19805 [Anaerocolumna sp. AGMB13020]|nr:hypothetical protein [Anaerocolumna sp. AGMB13020]WOO36018.1 hypothetical protein R2R35_19805 [Anaerocolumna sp. AGMB13020]